MSIALKIQLPNSSTESATWTKVIEGGKILVRHGRHLYKVDFQTQQIEKSIKISEEPYSGLPLACYEQNYYELSEQNVRTWNTYTFEETGNYQLLKPLNNNVLKDCAYMQLGGHILVATAQFLLDFSLQQLEYIVIARVPRSIAPLAPCAIMLQAKSQLLFCGNGSGSVFDTFKF